MVLGALMVIGVSTWTHHSVGVNGRWCCSKGLVYGEAAGLRLIEEPGNPTGSGGGVAPLSCCSSSSSSYHCVSFHFEYIFFITAEVIYIIKWFLVSSLQEEEPVWAPRRNGPIRGLLGRVFEDKAAIWLAKHPYLLWQAELFFIVVVCSPQFLV